jgi:GNAT superfamily N-acetyltransferase
MSLEVRINPTVSQEDLVALFTDARGSPEHDCPDFPTLLEHAMFYACGYVDGRLIGFAKVIWDGGEHGFLLDPTVSTAHRRKGIGKQIVSACVREAGARGVSWLHVDFEPHLAAFYRSCGFRSTEAGLMNLRDSLTAGSDHETI